MAVIFVVIIITGIIGLFIYADVKKKKALPKKIESVKKLIDYLNHIKIEIYFCEFKSDEGVNCIEDSISLNFFGLARFSNKILSTQYAEDLVLFNYDSNQLFDLEKFSNDKFLPNSIMEELLNFNATNFKLMEFKNAGERQRFVNIRTGLWVGTKLPDNKQLIESEIHAFESWQNLIECAEQLEFVIVQWLKDAEVPDNGNNFGIVNNLS